MTVFDFIVLMCIVLLGVGSIIGTLDISALKDRISKLEKLMLRQNLEEASINARLEKLEKALRTQGLDV